MTIPFTCPHCGAYSQVAANYAGMTGPCAQCGGTITIPSAVPNPYQGDAGAVSLPAQRRTSWLWILLAVGALACLFVCGGGLVALLLPAVNAAREAARRTQCANNLRQIAFALESYHSDHGCYPPAWLAGPDGAPMHSWRALLLPYLDEELADEYNFDEPWDSADNQQLWHRMPMVFACPSNPDSPPLFTSYVAIVGPGNLFVGDQPTQASQFPQPGMTIAVAEIDGHERIPWLEPRDLEAGSLGVVGDSSQPSISSNHIGGANALMADWTVEYLAAGSLVPPPSPVASP
ncbi:MAG: DUF1559 domain-containing protein [Planctomycetaceae bacterium]|nr:DUF1559 domain-containing protein [Planctomycetaceae bacterium]